MFKGSTIGAMVVIMACLTGVAQAASVYGEPADFTGSRSVTNGLEVIADRFPGAMPGDWSGGTVAWEITLNPDGLTANYRYTFSGFVGPPSISHIALDLTPDAVDDPNAVTDVTIDGEPVDADDLEFGTVEGIETGVKIDEGVNGDGGVYEFTSNRFPVWGDIAIEAGQEVGQTHFLVQNTGFGDQTLEDSLNYIARPNSVIPTPAAAGAGLMLLGGLLMRRRSSLETASGRTPA